MTPQAQNIFDATDKYAREAREGYRGVDIDGPELERIVRAAYVSGVLVAASALAASDGIHPSKLAEAAREAGILLTGVQPSL